MVDQKLEITLPKAKYNWLLFIDCDSKIENKYFIKNYLNNTRFDEFVIYGKTTYQKNEPKKKQNTSLDLWKKK